MKYLVKRRDTDGLGNRQAFSGKQRLRWSAWRTVASFTAEADAVAKMDALAGRGGLQQVAVYHGGRMVLRRGG